MHKLTYVMDRKDDAVVTTHATKFSNVLFRLYSNYSDGGWDVRIWKPYGFICYKGGQKVIAYMKGGKELCRS